MKEYYDFPSGFILGAILGLAIGSILTIVSINEPIYCGNKICTELQKK